MLTVQGTLDSAAAATVANLAGTYSNGTLGVGATLTATTNGALVVDGYAANPGDRILLLAQTVAQQNGVYGVTAAGSSGAAWVLTRVTDFNNSVAGQVKAGAFIYVVNGVTNGGTSWIETGVGTGTAGAIILGTDAVSFTESNAVLYTFPPNTAVYVVQAASYGIALGTVSSVSTAFTGPSTSVTTYQITYSNPVRTAAAVDSTLVFGSLASAWAYYQTVIT